MGLFHWDTDVNFTPSSHHYKWNFATGRFEKATNWGNPFASSSASFPNPVVQHVQDIFAPGSQFREDLGLFGDWISSAVNKSLWPTLEPTVNRFAGFLHHSPEMVSAIVVLLVIFVSIQIVRLMHRVVRFWTRLLVRLAFWGVVGLVVSMAWDRGLEQSIRDLVLVGTGLYRWGKRAGQVFWDEYEKAQREVQDDWKGW